MRKSRIALCTSVVVAVMALALAVSPTGRAQAVGTAPATAYVHYYLWWTPQHWQSKLGSSYPYTASPLPLPGHTDSTGCNPTVSYAGATIVDIPSEGLYDQSLASTFDYHISLAANAGITGFLADWQGTGQAGQGPSSSGYNQRLDLLVQRVNAYNSTHGTHFSIGVALASFGDYSRPVSAILNDLSYIRSHYSGNPALANRYSADPIVMVMDSRKLSPLVGQTGSVLPQLYSAYGSTLYLVGDETSATWAADGRYLDAGSYYWSSENPWTNTGAQSQIDSLGSQVHNAGKRWFAPVEAGYNKQLTGGTCVPRYGLQTLDKVWSMNKTSYPDGWFAISWNEFVENTYLEPSSAYGAAYLQELSRLIAAG
jgi:hypothetical protein